MTRREATNKAIRESRDYKSSRVVSEIAAKTERIAIDKIREEANSVTPQKPKRREPVDLSFITDDNFEVAVLSGKAPSFVSEEPYKYIVNVFKNTKKSEIESIKKIAKSLIGTHQKRVSEELPPDKHLKFYTEIKQMADGRFLMKSIISSDDETYSDMSRVVSFDAKTVDHHLLEFDKELQGKGIAKEIFFNAVKSYKEEKMKKVFVHADLDVGGGTWFKFGFEPEHPDDALVQIQAKAKVLTDSLNENRELYEQMNPSVSKISTSHISSAMKKVEDRFKEYIKDGDRTALMRINEGMSKEEKTAYSLMTRSLDWYGTLDLENEEIMDKLYKYLQQ
jgi:hypothetical protein